MPPRFLSPGSVEIWLLPLAGCDPAADAALLSEAERARHDRLHQAEDRRRFAAGRAWVRRLLSLYADVPPAGWRIETNCNGRPLVRDPGQFGFFSLSLAHARDRIACAVSADCELGIDLEDRIEAADAALAPVILAPEERAVHAGLGPEPARRFLARSWVLKEAYTKALGYGHAIAFDQIALAPAHGPEARVVYGPPIEQRPQRWHLQLFELAGACQLGVAAAPRFWRNVDVALLEEEDLPMALRAASLV